MATITFHSMADSAYLWTAMQVADEKGVEYRLEPLELGSEAHLLLNPFGKMPVLQHDQVVLYETLAIAHYIDRAFPGPDLQPADPLGQAHVLRWISIVNAYVFPVMNRFVKERLVRPAWGFDTDAAFLQSARAALLAQIRQIDDAVGDDGYLVGDQLTLADAFLLPHLLFFGRTPEGAALLKAAPRVAGWLTRMTERPSYVQSDMRRAYETFRQLPAATPVLWTAQ
ncbi:MAG: glutathione S-transferase family protein [Phenylobacterium sp.]|uniref:glutathione S-transferase family protein n=1 Tax=Phenylobacterium sp. TaxID=1871053 RepID=UPI00271ACFC0|nr:glutathione S-transferase family protein [Phenylobacterium sp.]MDO8913375.1 glutathione S-transferase family protein [Phenylobacterium sp.]MDP3101220.1 glutathione S-transferase family protein [Phenylobacterium sp.]